MVSLWPSLILSVLLISACILSACSTRVHQNVKPLASSSPPVLNVFDNSRVEDGEESDELNIRVNLNKPSTSDVLVEYTTKPGSARPGEDYEVSQGKVTLQKGETEAEISIQLIADKKSEPDEFFYLIVTQVSGAELGKRQAIAVIVDNDTESRSCSNCSEAIFETQSRQQVEKKKKVDVIVTPAAAAAPAKSAESTESADECSKKPAVRIMPMGDSITLGGHNNKGGYRRFLSRMLSETGYRVDFVGSRKNGTGFDAEHEGWSGYTTDNVIEHAYQRVMSNRPDVVLLHIGTNGKPSVEKMERLLNEIDAASIETQIILAQIINTKTPNKRTSQYNQALAGLYQRRLDKGDRLLLVNMEAGLTPQDMVDEKHPNAQGYEKMARLWFAALIKILVACHPSVDTSVPASK